MLSSNQYQNTMSSFDFDDLRLLPIDFISDNEYNNYSDLDDDMTINRIDLSPEIDQYQQQTSSSSSSSPSSHSLPTETLVSNLICGVCGAPATGYNFDQITCESCKAFFRRNALRYMGNLKCRFAGSCVININTRRQCTYCRLKKCFDIKMRKDWIRTEEETKLRQLQKLVKEQRKFSKLTNEPQPLVNLPLVARKKKRLMIKPIIQELAVDPIFTQNNEDHVLLNNITNAYQLEADNSDCSHLNKYIQNPHISHSSSMAKVLYMDH